MSEPATEPHELIVIGGFAPQQKARCPALTKTGKVCGAPCIKGHNLCYNHEPGNRGRWVAAGKSGGRPKFNLKTKTRYRRTGDPDTELGNLNGLCRRAARLFVSAEQKKLKPEELRIQIAALRLVIDAVRARQASSAKEALAQLVSDNNTANQKETPRTVEELLAS